MHNNKRKRRMVGTTVQALGSAREQIRSVRRKAADNCSRDPVSRPPEFKEFIATLLQRIPLKPSNVVRFTDEDSLIEFSRAFTHKTWSPTFNYERYEFLGDTIVNDTVAKYICSTFPEIQNVAWMTRIKHTLISKKYLALVAYKANFLSHIRYGPKLDFIMDPRTAPRMIEAQNKEFLSLLEDTFEAFVGCLRFVIDQKTSYGAGCVLARCMVQSFFTKKDIPVTYDAIFDPKSRLKEVYDKRHWGFSVRSAGQAGHLSASMIISREVNGNCLVEVFGYPSGTQEKNSANRILLCRAAAPTKDVAQQKAAKLALRVLETEYKIFEERSCP